MTDIHSLISLVLLSLVLGSAVSLALLVVDGMEVRGDA